MFDKIQIGTIAYKQNDKYAKAFPLLAKETEELKQAKKNLFCNVSYIFISDLQNLAFKRFFD